MQPAIMADLSHPPVEFAHLWTGGSPQSPLVHIPGSRINRQYARRRSQRWLAFNSAIERRTVRSEPVQPSP